MLITNVNNNKEFEITPAGVHTATLYKIVDLGSHLNSHDNMQRLVRFSWELPEELMEDGRPFSVDGQYSLSLADNSHLTKLLTGWLGEKPDVPFDPATLLGKSGNISVVHNKSKDGTKTYANVSGMQALKKNEKAPAQINTTFIFDLDNYEEEKLEALPEWLRNKIKESPEYTNVIQGNNPNSDFAQSALKGMNDEIPY